MNLLNNMKRIINWLKGLDAVWVLLIGYLIVVTTLSYISVNY